MNTLTQRYSRQLILKNWSLEKQQRLAQLTVFVPSQLPCTALYLAAAGVGRLVFDGDSRFASHIKSLNPSVEILDGKLVRAENIDIQIEIVDDASSDPLETTHSEPTKKIVVSSNLSDKLYASAMASSKVISLVHFGKI